MILDGVFKCQDCGAVNTDLMQTVSNRMVCIDRKACHVMQILEGLGELMPNDPDRMHDDSAG